MTTNSALAPAFPRLETKAAAPAVADPVAAIAAKIDAQGEQIARQGATISTLEAKQALHERKSRVLEALRDSAEEKAKTRPDPLIDERMRRQNADIDETERRELKELRAYKLAQERKAARPHGPARLPGPPGQSPLMQQKAAIAMLEAAQVNYLRTGETQFKGHSIRQLEQAVYGPNGAKAMHSGSNADGGYLVTSEEDNAIERMLTQVVPMRQHANVRTINAANYKKYVRTATGGARWGNELNSGGETATPKYALLDFPAHNLYAEPLVSRDLVDDSGFDIIGEINDGCLEDFEITENIAFIAGDGIEKPFGILGYPAANYVANASWAFGKIGFMATGANGAFPTSSGSVGSADPILKLPMELKQAYRQSAKWMGNRSTMGVARILKDGNGAYVWIQSDLARGVPATLAGHEFIEAEQMPDIATNSFSLALADWKKAYTIVDRSGMSVLRDELTRYPSIAFKSSKRVGGGIMNYDALKLLKFAA